MLSIVMTGRVANHAALQLASERRDELLLTLPERFLDRILRPETGSRENIFPVVSDICNEVKYKTGLVQQVLCGGVFGGLWDMGESLGMGLEADLRDIPIRQETIEICNALDINPYKLDPAGVLLIAIDNEGAFIRTLMEAGIDAALIGRFTEGNDRIIINKGKRRFLEPPEKEI